MGERNPSLEAGVHAWGEMSTPAVERYGSLGRSEHTRGVERDTSSGARGTRLGSNRTRPGGQEDHALGGEGNTPLEAGDTRLGTEVHPGWRQIRALGARRHASGASGARHWGGGTRVGSERTRGTPLVARDTRLEGARCRLAGGMNTPVGRLEAIGARLGARGKRPLGARNKHVVARGTRPWWRESHALGGKRNAPLGRQEHDVGGERYLPCGEGPCSWGREDLAL